MEAYLETEASPTQTPGPVQHEIEAHDVYGLIFGRSLYGWKDNDKSFPTLPVLPPRSTGVIRNG
jgi:hypothetical protein